MTGFGPVDRGSNPRGFIRTSSSPRKAKLRGILVRKLTTEFESSRVHSNQIRFMNSSTSLINILSVFRYEEESF